MKEKNKIEESIAALEKKNLSRKDFLKLSGAAAVALAVFNIPKQQKQLF